MTEVMVKLGGQEYTLHPLPMKKARAWRQKLEQPFQELTAALEQADTVRIDNLADVASVVRVFSGQLLGSIDLVLELLFEFSPELAADRERIEEEAYDEEALAAFVEVLKLAYPFGVLSGLVNGSMPGR